MLTVTDKWKSTWPGAVVGTLVMRNAANPPSHPELDRRKDQLEAELRARFANLDRTAIDALPAIQAYKAYYAHFKKTYHVQLQLESIVFKGKSIPRVAALVESMFMAELKNQILTAGHDLDVVQAPVTLNAASGTERYMMLNGKETELKADDMMMADTQGVISSVIYGPDKRTCITPTTQRAFFVVYAPAGIGEPAVRQHLQDIQANIVLVAPQAEVESLDIYAA